MTVGSATIVGADENAREREPLAVEGEYLAPEFRKGHYHCPRCGVLAPQAWKQLSWRAENQDWHADAWIVHGFSCRAPQVLDYE